MSDNRIIEVSNLSKRYRLGNISSQTLKQDFARWWTINVRKQQDPFQKIGEQSNFNKKEFLWALKDINFSVNEGEAIGIIGKNGAGKSTLLKILSRITRPTMGSVNGHGRMASLLEVGTGFHEDLTGRENIYLNGNIMGMTRVQVSKKLDEIIEFAGVSDYIDTPVKRYSSGMYVRLAFSVAAHLDADILIVDEVLAVGDAEFQKKCLGKMRDASRNQGRTVLFVSHQLQAVQNFCERTLWIDSGNLRADGNTKEVIQQYLGSIQQKDQSKDFDSPDLAPGNEKIKIKSVSLHALNEDPSSAVDVRTPMEIRFSCWCFAEEDICIDLLLFTVTGDCVFDAQSPAFNVKKGIWSASCSIPGNLLNDGSYYISLFFADKTGKEIFNYGECLFFEVEDFRENTTWYGKWWGYVRPKLEFKSFQEPI